MSLSRALDEYLSRASASSSAPSAPSARVHIHENAAVVHHVYAGRGVRVRSHARGEHRCRRSRRAGDRREGRSQRPRASPAKGARRGASSAKDPIEVLSSLLSRRRRPSAVASSRGRRRRSRREASPPLLSDDDDDDGGGFDSDRLPLPPPPPPLGDDDDADAVGTDDALDSDGSEAERDRRLLERRRAERAARFSEAMEAAMGEYKRGMGMAALRRTGRRSLHSSDADVSAATPLSASASVSASAPPGGRAWMFTSREERAAGGSSFLASPPPASAAASSTPGRSPVRRAHLYEDRSVRDSELGELRRSLRKSKGERRRAARMRKLQAASAQDEAAAAASSSFWGEVRAHSLRRDGVESPPLLRRRLRADPGASTDDAGNGVPYDVLERGLSGSDASVARPPPVPATGLRSRTVPGAGSPARSLPAAASFEERRRPRVVDASVQAAAMADCREPVSVGSDAVSLADDRGDDAPPVAVRVGGSGGAEELFVRANGGWRGVVDVEVRSGNDDDDGGGGGRSDSDDSNNVVAGAANDGGITVPLRVRIVGGQAIVVPPSPPGSPVRARSLAEFLPPGQSGPASPDSAAGELHASLDSVLRLREALERGGGGGGGGEDTATSILMAPR